MTLTSTVLPLMLPGVLEAVAETDNRFVEIHLSGAINSQILGITSDKSSWYEHPELSAVIGSTTKPWAGKMLSMPPLTLRRSSEDLLLTTSYRNNPFANSDRYSNRIEFDDMNITTAVNELTVLGGIVSRPADRELNADSGLISSNVQVPVPMNVGHEAWDLTEEEATALSSIASTMGYKVSRDAPLLGRYTNFHPSSVVTKAGLAEAFNKITTNTLPLSGVAQSINLMLAGTPPGVKYLFIVESVSSVGAGAAAVLDQAMILHSASKSGGLFFFAIPVVDDGSDSTILYVKSINNIGDQAEWIERVPDSRYVSVDNGVQVRYYKFLVDLYSGGKTITTPLGKTVEYSQISEGEFENYPSLLGDTFLCYLMPPLEHQHYVCRSVETEVVTETVDGIPIEVTIHRLDVDFFATKITKEWYEDYYTTGFGLYKPRSSAIQANILKDWNKLNFSSFGICVDVGYSTVSPDIVFDSDLAHRYAKARKDACKDNDWLEQPFTEEFTYGAIRSMIQAQPHINAFYSATSYSSTQPDFAPPQSNGSWAKVNGAYVYTEGEVETTYELGDESLLAVYIDSVSGGASTAISWETIKTDFSLTAEELAGLNQALAEAQSGYVTYHPETRGFLLKEQYFYPEQALAMSGYPVYRYMAHTYRTNMVMRMYAGLSRIGDPLLRVIQSFTGDVIVNKIKASLS